MRKAAGQRAEPLAAWWLAALGAAALLVMAAAWQAIRDPGLSGQAGALTEVRALAPILEKRGRDLAVELAEGRSELAPELRFHWDAATGRLLEPRPLARPGEVQDLAAAGELAGPPPAAAWLEDARLRFARGEDQEAAQAVEQGLAALEEGDAATAAGLRLLEAQGMQRSGRLEEAAAVWQDLAATLAPDATWEGRPLYLIAHLQLAAAQENLGRIGAARQTRASLLELLLDGALPLPPGRLAFEARLLHDLLPEQGLPDLEALAARFELAGALQQALDQRGSSRVLEMSDWIAFLAPGAVTGYLYPRAGLASFLDQEWRELLPASQAFALSAPGETAQGPVLMALAAPLGLGRDWRLSLARPEVYTEPAARRRWWIATATAVLVAALAAVGVLGARALRRRAELDHLRGDFIAGVSHELRTPAASLCVLAENLAEGRVVTEERRAEYFQALRREARRLQRLVHDVLDFSRAERGVFRVEAGPCDLAALLRESVDEHQARFAASGMRLELEATGDLPEAELDAGAVSRALANLLDNARKYAAAGGVVRVSAGVSAGELLLAVEDEGPGVPPAWRRRVFEPFTRGPGNDRDGFPAGAGLGLALVAETVKAHGGAVAVEDGRGGRGARFVLRFPRRPSS